MCVCVCVCVYARACVRACACVCVQYSQPPPLNRQFAVDLTPNITLAPSVVRVPGAHGGGQSAYAPDPLGSCPFPHTPCPSDNEDMDTDVGLECSQSVLNEETEPTEKVRRQSGARIVVRFGKVFRWWWGVCVCVAEGTSQRRPVTHSIFHWGPLEVVGSSPEASTIDASLRSSSADVTGGWVGGCIPCPRSSRRHGRARPSGGRGFPLPHNLHTSPVGEGIGRCGVAQMHFGLMGCHHGKRRGRCLMPQPDFDRRSLYWLSCYAAVDHPPLRSAPVPCLCTRTGRASLPSDVAPPPPDTH